MKSRRTLTRIPFGEWLPDQPAIGNPGLIAAKNVIPLTAESYGPMPKLEPESDPLAGNLLGFAWMEDTNQQYFDFAADDTALYYKEDTSASWTDISQTGVTYAPPYGWAFATYGSLLIAVDGADAPQAFLLGTDTEFSDLSADAPVADFVAVIRDFVFLASLPDYSPYRVQWSAVGDPTIWPTPGTDAALQVQSDYQDLQQSDLGIIRGIVAGPFAGDDGAIWCERGIYRIVYVGSPAIFQFLPVPGASGTGAPRSIVKVAISGQAGGVGFYLGADGFCMFDGSASHLIGGEKFNQTFFDSIAKTRLSEVVGAADPIRKLVFWGYHSTDDAEGFDRLLIYNWEVGHAALCVLDDAMLRWIVYRPLGGTAYGIGAFDVYNQLGRFTGDNMAPELETGDRQLFPGRRMKIQSVRPMNDGGTASVAVAARNLPTDAVTYQTAVEVNALGECPQRVNGRYARYKLTLPEASSFTHLQGLEVSAAPEGMRR